MHRFLIFNVILALALTACVSREPVQSDASVAERAIDVEAFAGELPIADPWLRDQLPAGVLTYQRIPNLLAVIGMPKGNVLDTALGSDANIRNFVNIQRGLFENLADDSPLFDGALYGLLVNHLRSPIELIGMGFPQPGVMVAMTLDLRSNAELEALFRDLNASFSELPTLAGRLNAEGFGQLAAPLPILVHFEQATGRLALYGGVPLPGAPPPTQATLAQLLTPPATTEPHRMTPIEAQIDERGHGYFSWIDTTQALAMAGMFNALPPDAAQMLTATGLDQLQAVAFGTGVADGKGRLKIVADVGQNRANRPFPVVDNQITATSVGAPTSLFLLSIPSAAEYSRLESLALSYFPPEVAEQWSGMKQEIAAEIGASIEDILASLGPELVAFSDRAGNFVGLKVQDSLLFDDVLQRLTSSHGLEVQDRVVDGQTIHYLELPAGAGMPAAGISVPGAPGAEAIPGEGEVAPAALAALQIIGRMHTRLYWVDDGDYLYFAGIPQALMDRNSMGAGTNIGAWLSDSQRVDLSSSFFAATGTVAKLPRMMYEAYVGMMQNVADIAEVEYDIWSMPSVAQLGLPERGALGLSFNLGEPYLSLELTFESNPGEVLLAGGGVGTVAAVGILAAIAIPAYQDYTIRAQVSEGLNLSAAAKFAIAQSWLDTGAAPSDRAAAGMTPDASDTIGRYIASVDVDDGVIVITYGNKAHERIAGDTLTMAPYVGGDGSVVWACGYFEPPAGVELIGGSTDAVTTLDPQYLPSACRD